jgi:hypothetical protein
VNEFLARNIDRFFMRLMLRFRDAEAEIRPDIGEHFRALVERFRKLNVPEGLFPPELGRKLLLERTEKFSETVVCMDEQMPGLPAPLSLSRPAIYHFYPVRCRAKAALVLLHGWRQPVLGAVGRFARYCAVHGIASVVLELPGHLGRKLPGRAPGEGFTSADPEVLLPHLFHTVVEAEAARRFLKETHGGVPAGILGVSLGGWPAALSAMVFEPDYLFLIAPATAPARTFGKSILLERRREELVAGGWSVEGFVDALKMLSPMFNDPLVPGSTVGVMSGRYDEVIPYNDVLDFTRLWETRPIIPLEHGHFSMLYFYPSLFVDVLRELEALIADLPAGERP